MVYDDLRTYSSKDDVVIFQHVDQQLIGEIIGLDEPNNGVRVRLFSRLTSELLLRYELPSTTTAEAPFTTKSGMVEVMRTGTTMVIGRSSIIDIAFVIPLVEIEGGFIHLTGAANMFFICFELSHSNDHPQEVMFRILLPRIVEPFSRRIFRNLNYLSSEIKKRLYHQAEEGSTTKSFRILFPYESFFYLLSKLRTNTGISFHQFERKQRFVLYYEDLSMKNDIRSNNIHVIRVLSSDALKALRGILGVGVGIGLAKNRPTKSKPLINCRVGDIITSIEPPCEVPIDVATKPLLRTSTNGVDFIYTIENQSLQCNIR